jgi:NAD-dependent dihydropyrimidine dehydrogenase PreA subunit
MLDTRCIDISDAMHRMPAKDIMNLIVFLCVLCELCVSVKPKKSLEFSR